MALFLQVVEVRASGVLNNRLQFPSITSIRVDKRVEEIDSVRDVHEFEEVERFWGPSSPIMRLSNNNFRLCRRFAHGR